MLQYSAGLGIGNDLEFTSHDASTTELRCLHRTVSGDCLIRRGDAFLFRPGAWHGYEQCEGLSINNCCFDAAIFVRELESGYESWIRPTPIGWGLPILCGKCAGCIWRHHRNF